MNEVTKLFWAAALLIVGFLAASWLGPAPRDASRSTALPTGWSAQRLEPLAADSTPTQFTTSDPVAPAELAVPQLDYSLAPPALTSTPPADLAPAAEQMSPAPATNTWASQAPSPTSDSPFATGDNWWQSSSAAGPAEWQNPAEPVRSLADAQPAPVAAPAVGHDPPALLAPDTTAPPLIAETAPRFTPIQPPQELRFQAPTFGAWDQAAVAPAEVESQIHVVSDGDDLNRLAERYLGDASRAQEIFEANRDVLQSPKLLPINAELRIPGGTRSTPTAATTLSNTWGTNSAPQARLQPPQAVTSGYAPHP